MPIEAAALLVERLGEGGGGSDVGIAGSLVGTSGLLEGLSVSKVGGAVGLVGSGVVGLKVDIEELGEHLDVVLEAYFSARVVAILIARCAAVLSAAREDVWRRLLRGDGHGHGQRRNASSRNRRRLGGFRTQFVLCSYRSRSIVQCMLSQIGSSQCVGHPLRGHSRVKKTLLWL